MLIFVYGTLKQGHRNNYLLSEAKYLGSGTTKDKYGLYKATNGSFPFMITSKQNGRIPGELYEIDKDTEDELDILEGYPNLYIKKDIVVICEKDNKEVIAKTYIKNEKNYKDIIDYNSQICEWKSSY